MSNNISKSDKIISIVFVSYFVITIMAIVIISSLELPAQYTIMCIAQVFLVLGIIITYSTKEKSEEVVKIKGKHRKKFPIGWVLTIIGFLGIGVPVATLMGVDVGEAIMYSASGGFVAIGVLMLYIHIADKRRALKVCTSTIQAKVIGHKEVTTYSNIGQPDFMETPSSTTHFLETFEYEYLGKKFIYQSDVSSNLKIGDTKKIYIDPNNPETAFDISVQSEIVAYVLCIGSILAGLFIFSCIM